ncbi:MaoC/PaaZ C-terminal domain-containing protein [Haloarchaeobius sp. DFWS5]|uniref:MaoC/PaaZ C-terminal domain-containing protein n=1 Tax=Haloarchaeobius sp. DFWS5 TaxID=3446114 RepID=UPI003EBF95A1
MPIDPVCGMEIPTESVETTSNYEGERFSFCSPDCLKLFEGSPQKYIETPHPHLVEASGAILPRLPYGRAKGEFNIEITDSTSLQEGDSVSFSKVITDEDVRKFAEATSDTNALHLNDSFAEKTRFGHRIVHGTLVSGLISAALACFPGLTIYISQTLEFRRPVNIGESLTAQCKIVEKLADNRYRLTTHVKNGSGETVLDGTATVLIDPLLE